MLFVDWKTVRVLAVDKVLLKGIVAWPDILELGKLSVEEMLSIARLVGIELIA